MSELVAEAVPEWDRADRMRKALRYAGVGVQEIADYLDVDRSTVSNWLGVRIIPSVQTLRLWAARCGVSYPWLVTGDKDADDDLIRLTVKRDCLSGCAA